MQMLIQPLELTTPIAAFNGVMFIRPDLSVIEQHALSSDIVEAVIETITSHRLDVWIYRGIDWFIRQPHGPHVDREEWTVRMRRGMAKDFSWAASAAQYSELYRRLIAGRLSP